MTDQTNQARGKTGTKYPAPRPTGFEGNQSAAQIWKDIVASQQTAEADNESHGARS